MASNIVSGLRNTGLTLRPIQGTNVNTGLMVNPINVNPAFQAGNSVFEALRFKEQQHQFDQNLKLQLQREQRALFNDSFTQSRGTKGVRDSNYGLDPLLASHATKIAELRQKEQAAMQRLQSSFASAAQRSGRPSVDGYLNEINSFTSQFEQELLNDREYANLALLERQKEGFLDQIKNLESQGYTVNYTDVNKAINAYNSSANDTTGAIGFNQNMFNPQEYIYDADAASEFVETAITGAIGETELIELTNLTKEQDGVDALLSTKQNVQREKEAAVLLAAKALKADANTMRTLRAQGVTDVESYVRDILDSRMRSEDLRTITTGVNQQDINATRRTTIAADAAIEEAKIKADSALATQQEMTRRKQVTGGGTRRVSSGTSGSTASTTTPSSEEGATSSTESQVAPRKPTASEVFDRKLLTAPNTLSDEEYALAATTRLINKNLFGSARGKGNLTDQEVQLLSDYDDALKAFQEAKNDADRDGMRDARRTMETIRPFIMQSRNIQSELLSETIPDKYYKDAALVQVKSLLDNDRDGVVEFNMGSDQITIVQRDDNKFVLKRQDENSAGKETFDTLPELTDYLSRVYKRGWQEDALELYRNEESSETAIPKANSTGISAKAQAAFDTM